MPGDRKFDLGDYVEVKDRIRILYELYPQARLVTRKVKVLTAPDGKQRVMVHAQAYRTPDDPLPGDGYSWMELPGTTSYTRGSEIENTETSAWGRAIGALGILIDRSIATAQEVDNKQREIEPESSRIISTKDHPVTVNQPDPDLTPDGGLIGTAVAQGNQDFNLRQSPDGWSLPFRVKTGAKSFIVLAEGDLARAMDLLKATIIDQRVTVWGHWTDEHIPAKGTKPAINYRILHLSRIQTPDGVLPATDEPPDDVALVGEAPSERMGLVPDDEL